MLKLLASEIFCSIAYYFFTKSFWWSNKIILKSVSKILGLSTKLFFPCRYYRNDVYIERTWNNSIIWELLHIYIKFVYFWKIIFVHILIISILHCPRAWRFITYLEKIIWWEDDWAETLYGCRDFIILMLL